MRYLPLVRTLENNTARGSAPYRPEATIVDHPVLPLATVPKPAADGSANAIADDPFEDSALA